MKFGICTPYQDVLQIKERPFEYVEENVQRFLVPEEPEEVFEDHLRATSQFSLPIEAANSFLPGSISLVATSSQQVDTERINRYVQTAFRRAERAGIRVIVFGSGAARACPPDFAKDEALEQLAQHLTCWSEWAVEHGIALVLEPLRYEETNTFNTVDESGQFVSRHAASGLRLLADVYHMASNREDPATIVPWSSLLTHVHVAELQDRAAPGRYGESFSPYFRALRQAGYDQRMSIECRWIDKEHEMKKGIQVLREQWASSVS